MLDSFVSPDQHLSKLDARVLVVEQHLEQNGHVDEDLDRTADPELSRAVVHNKVGGFEDVTRGPQQDHLHTHALGGVVVEVLEELWQAKHSLKHQSHGAQRLHKHSRIQQQQSDHCTQHREAQTEQEVVFKLTPLPEVIQVQICKSVLFCAHSVGVLDGTAEMEHGKHRQDHHNTLKKQGQLKLLSNPEENA